MALGAGVLEAVDHVGGRRRVGSEPFIWTATAEDILAKVRLVQTNVRKLVQNNSK
jgi:hypothetical protein